MISRLPKPEIRATYLIPASAIIPELTFIVEAAIKGSDIKWNDMEGVIRIVDKSNFSYASCHLGHFTGNCGAKYIAHLYLIKSHLLSLIESFAFHKTNCGLLIGSDTTEPYTGNTLSLLKTHGKNYQVLPSVKNPNWNHHTALFWKDLNKETYIDYWQNGKEERLD